MTDSADEFGGGADIDREEGLHIWRIENMLPVRIDESEYGKFYTGDSYMVLKVTDHGSYFEKLVHFWIGDESSPDEQSAAALKSLELCRVMGECPQRREVQGHESPEFLGYFGFMVEYLAGGIEGALRRAKIATEYERRLLHVKGTKKVRMLQVPLSYESLNSGDVFILDTQHAVYQFAGSGANPLEKGNAMVISMKLRNVDHRSLADIVYIDEDLGDIPQAFWDALGGIGPIAEAVDDDENDPNDGDDEKKRLASPELYRVTDESGKLEMYLEGEEGQPLTKSLLDTNDAFILNCGVELFVWLGRGCTGQEKAAALMIASKFLEKHSLPSWTPITRIDEEKEPDTFKKYFTDFAPPLPKRARPPPKPMFNVDFSKFFVQAKEEVGVQVSSRGNKEDDSIIEIYRVEGIKNLTELEPQYHGIFYSGEVYAVLHRGPRSNDIFYYWQGKESGKAGMFAYQDTEDFITLEKLKNRRPNTVKIKEGHETNDFLSLFCGRMVVRKGGTSGLIKRPKKKAALQPHLFHVKGTSVINTRAVEVECVAASLNSGDSYVAQDGTSQYTWFGRGSNEDERGLALNISAVLRGERRPHKIEEGSEPDEFWELLGGKAPYAQDMDATPEEQHEARLFQLSYGGGGFALEECVNYTQDDLDMSDVFILDCHKEVFAWIGTQANKEEKDHAMETAEKYAAHAFKVDSTRPEETPILKVEAGREPPSFRGKFLGWKPFQIFEDPAERRAREIKEREMQEKAERAGNNLFGANCYAIDEKGWLPIGVVNRDSSFIVQGVNGKDKKLDQGGAIIKVDIINDELVFPVPCTIIDIGDGTYQAKYVSKIWGIFQTTIWHEVWSEFKSQYDKDYVKGSPYTLEIINKVLSDPPQCSAEGDNVYVATAGEPASFIVIARDEEKKVRDEGEEPFILNALLKNKINKHSKGGGDLPGESVALHLDSNISLDLAVCDDMMMEPPTNNEIPNSFANNILCFTYSGEPLTQKQLDANMKPAVSPGVIVDSLVIDLTNGHYEMKYTLIIAGDYDLNVVYDKVEAIGTEWQSISNGGKGGSPYHLLVGPSKPDPTMCSAYGPGLAGGIAGQFTQFTVELFDQYGNKRVYGGDYVRAVLDGPEEIIPSVSDDGNGNYSLVYKPRANGVFDMHVFVNVDGSEKEIIGSPFVSVIHSGKADPCKCVASPLRISDGQSLSDGSIGIIAGSESGFSITSRDVLGLDRTIGGDCFNVFFIRVDIPENIVSTTDAISIPATVTDSDDGSYEVNFKLYREGRYMLHITLGSDLTKSKPIDGSPFSLGVLPACPYAQLCVASGSGLISGFSNLRKTITIVTHDFYGNRCISGGHSNYFTVTAFCIDHTDYIVDHQVIDNNDGSYIVHYHAKMIGRYTIMINYNNSPILASPFTVFIAPGPASDAHCTVDGDGLSVAMAGRNAHFQITAFDEYGNRHNCGGEIFIVHIAYCELGSKQDDIVGLSLSLDDDSDPIFRYSSQTIPCIITDNNDGTYRVSYTPRFTGMITLHVKLSSNHLLGSPFSAKIKPGVVQGEECIGFGPGIRLLAAGESLVMSVIPRDSVGNICILDDSDSCELRVAIVSATIVSSNVSNNHKCSLDFDESSCRWFGNFTTKKAALYSVNISVNNRDICCSPFSVTVVPKGIYGGASARKSFLRITDRSRAITNSFINISAGEKIELDLVTRDSFGNYRLHGGDKVTAIFELVSIGHSAHNKSTVALQSLGAPISDCFNGQYRISFIPIIYGVYSIKVFIDDSEVEKVQCLEPSIPEEIEDSELDEDLLLLSDSPLFLNVSCSIVQASSSIPFGPGLTNGKCSSSGKFCMLLRDKYFNDVNGVGLQNSEVVIRFDGSATSPMVTSIDKHIDGIIIVNYNILQGGRFNIDVNINRFSAILCKGHVLHVPPASSSPSKCVIEWADVNGNSSGVPVTSGAKMVAGIPRSIIIQANDEFGCIAASVSDCFNISLGNDSVLFPVCALGPTHPGIYIATVASHVSVPNTSLNINLQNKPVKDSPCSISVVSGPLSASTSVAFGSGLTNLCVDSQSPIYVYAYDSMGNYRSCEVDDVVVVLKGDSSVIPTSPPVRFGKTGVGLTTALQPSTVGLLSVGVTVGGEMITGSPFEAHSRPGTFAPEKCISNGDGLKSCIWNKQTEFLIFTFDAKGNPLHHGGELFSVDVIGSVTSHRANIRDCGDGTYKVFYRHPHCEYYRVEVQHEKTAMLLAGSPLICECSIEYSSSITTTVSAVNVAENVDNNDMLVKHGDQILIFEDNLNVKATVSPPTLRRSNSQGELLLLSPHTRQKSSRSLMSSADSFSADEYDTLLKKTATFDERVDKDKERLRLERLSKRLENSGTDSTGQPQRALSLKVDVSPAIKLS